MHPGDGYTFSPHEAALRPAFIFALPFPVYDSQHFIGN